MVIMDMAGVFEGQGLQQSQSNLEEVVLAMLVLIRPSRPSMAFQGPSEVYEKTRLDRALICMIIVSKTAL